MLIRFLVSILTAVVFLYAYINKQNAIVELRLQIPNLSETLRVTEQENVRLKYEIDRFEDPLHLMELARRPEYSHLKYPLLDAIITLPRQIP